MDKQDFNRVLDQVTPSPQQKEAMLVRLLESERKGTPMKKLRKLTVVGIAAALMVIACAAAMAAGLDQRLLAYLGAGTEQAGLLASGAMPVDVTVEDNGATLHVSQVLMDRCSILLLADFTAPEGTVLDMDEEQDVDRGFGGLDYSVPDLLDQTGKEINHPGSWGWRTKVLEDGDPLDNHLTLLFQMELTDGIQPDWDISGMSLHNKDLVRYDLEQGQYITVYPGDWSCQIPFTWQDMGRDIQPNQVVGQLDGIDITLTEIYLSPMTLQIQLESETPIPQIFGGGIGNRWLSMVNSDRVTLTTQNGHTVPLTEQGGSADNQEQVRIFQLDEITDLSQFQTLALRIGDGSCDIPLTHLDS